MKKNLVDLINEEVEMFIGGLDKKELINVIPLLQEDIKLLNALAKVEKDYYDLDNQVTIENWKYFQESLKQVSKLDSFMEKALLTNCKLYAVKKFTQLEFRLPENIEDILKFEIKKYFNKLVTTDGEEFITELFNLPFEFISLVIRYVSKVLDPTIIKQITPSEELAEQFYNHILQIQKKFIKSINQVSLGESNDFNIIDARLLLDVKAFFKYNALNVGCLEYIVRLTNDSAAQEKLYAQYSKDTIDYMKEQAIFHPSYIQYLKKIKAEQIVPFFDSDGTQNLERDKTFDQIVKDIFEPQNVLPKVTEPTGTVTAEPTELDLTAQNKPTTPQEPQNKVPEEKPTQEPEKAPQNPLGV